LARERSSSFSVSRRAGSGCGAAWSQVARCIAGLCRSSSRLERSKTSMSMKNVYDLAVIGAGRDAAKPLDPIRNEKSACFRELSPRRSGRLLAANGAAARPFWNLALLKSACVPREDGWQPEVRSATQAPRANWREAPPPCCPDWPQSTSRHCETNQCPSRQTVAENGRFIRQFAMFIGP
jgi:hypothetical protein